MASKSSNWRLKEAEEHLQGILDLMAAADDLRSVFPDPATMSKEVRWYLTKVDKYLSGEANSVGEAMGLEGPPAPSIDEAFGLLTRPLNSDPSAAPRRRRARKVNLPRP
jgi:hypothetical protein